MISPNPVFAELEPVARTGKRRSQETTRRARQTAREACGRKASGGDDRKHGTVGVIASAARATGAPHAARHPGAGDLTQRVSLN